ncbi:mCG9993, partial [Mus musculus]
GAASQENPRNLCKKLTMKFKKFYDFGAIFEWSESIGKVWLEGDHRWFFPPQFRVHVKMTCNIAKKRRNFHSNLRSGAVIINGFIYHDLSNAYVSTGSLSVMLGILYLV